jgi:hypothetical protein
MLSDNTFLILATTPIIELFVQKPDPFLSFMSLETLKFFGGLRQLPLSESPKLFKATIDVER